jgi:molybdenum cofactor guanylyltransferase
MTTAALVLAGGSARRMGGGDKPLQALGGRPMLAWVIRRLGIANVAISANGDPARFADFGCPVLDDGVFGGEGPLAGILAGLDWAASLGADALLSVPGDTPFVPVGLEAALAPAPACAASLGRAHYLVALWPVGCRTGLRSLLSSPGRRDIRGFAAAIGMRVVDFPVENSDPFMNINTLDDLAAARAILSAQGEGDAS